MAMGWDDEFGEAGGRRSRCRLEVEIDDGGEIETDGNF